MKYEKIEFEKALKQAQKVLDKQAGELDAITNAKAELEVSYANLVKRGDIQSVKDELDTINKLKEKDYTSETWTILQDQVKLAQEFIKKDEATITEKEVISIFKSTKFDDVASNIIFKANENGGSDNITVIVVKL